MINIFKKQHGMGIVRQGGKIILFIPIYSSVTFFILPAVTLLTFTWIYLVASVFLYIGVLIFIGVDEKQLTKAFGKPYENYLKRADRLIPFKPGR